MLPLPSERMSGPPRAFTISSPKGIEPSRYAAAISKYGITRRFSGFSPDERVACELPVFGTAGRQQTLEEMKFGLAREAEIVLREFRGCPRQRQHSLGRFESRQRQVRNEGALFARDAQRSERVFDVSGKRREICGGLHAAPDHSRTARI